MLPAEKSSGVALIGLAVAAGGILLFTQLDKVVELRVSLNFLNLATLVSFAATLGGLLTAIVGSVIWARKAAGSRVLQVAVVVAVTIGLLVWLVDVNVHGPSAILMFVVPLGIVEAILLFVIAALRLKNS